MSAIRAYVFVCDEVLYSLTGKLLAQGIYTSGDIGISSAEQRTAQLVFVFTIEFPIEGFPSLATFKVEFPDTAPSSMTVPVAPPNAALLMAHPARKIWSFKYPMLVQQPVLKPGPIKTTLIYEGGEADAGTIWVTPLSANVTVGNKLS